MFLKVLYIKGMLKMYQMVFQRYIKNIFMDSKVYYVYIQDEWYTKCLWNSILKVYKMAY